MAPVHRELTNHMSGSFVQLTTLDEFPPGTMRRVLWQQRHILLANVDGEVFATDDLCTHEDASLTTGYLRGDLVTCPLHGSRFCVRTGEPMEEPAEEPLRCYAVRVDDGMVLVRVD